MMIKELSNEGLVEHYRGLKALIHNGAAMKIQGLGKMLRELDITIAIARKRGIRLPV